MYFTNGGIPTESSAIYVDRICDKKFQLSLDDTTSSKVICIHGPRQSGKTSLASRLLSRYHASCEVISLSFDSIFPVDPNFFDNEVDVAIRISANIAQKIGKFDHFSNWLDQIKGLPTYPITTGTQYFLQFLKEFLSRFIGARAIVFFDEFDEITKCTTKWEFLLRAFDLHASSEFGPKIRFVVAALVQPHYRLKFSEADRQSRAIFFESVHVSDFLTRSTSKTDEDFAEFSQTVGALSEGLASAPSKIERDAVERILDATGGQPYLTIKLLDELKMLGSYSTRDCETLIAEFILQNRWVKGVTSTDRNPHFMYAADALDFGGDGQEALEAYTSIRSGETGYAATGNIYIALMAAGLVSSRSSSLCVHSRLVSEIFNDVWILEISSRFVTRYTDDRRSSKNLPVRDDSKPTVLILNLGGTLGVDFGAADKPLPPTSPERFLREIPAIYQIANPVVDRPFSPKDGADIAPSDWKLLCGRISAAYDEDVEGVVVMMGTDTLAYAASAVAFALGKSVPFPIVFVGSQARRKRVFGDAVANILRAVQLACEGDQLRQVVICFNDEVFRAVRADKKDDYRYDGFWSPTEGPVAIFSEEVQYKTPKSALSKGFGAAGGAEPRIEFEEDILTVAQAPGLRPDKFIDLLKSGKFRGVKIESLGVGNLPTKGPYSFEAFVRCCVELELPVLISSRYPVQPDLAKYYEPAKKYVEIDKTLVMSARDMAPAAAHVKFMWAIAEADRRYRNRNVNPRVRSEAIKKIMDTDLVGEIIEHINEDQ